MIRKTLLLLLSTASLARAQSPATQPASPFDPARHWRVDDIKPGMKGYGLSVFQGDTIERFEVEVVGVASSVFMPLQKAILVRLSGANLEHIGVMQGMSGSPIYFPDANGVDKLAGAFAFGWEHSKDPIGGVQPIEQMFSQYYPPGANDAAESASRSFDFNRSDIASAIRGAKLMELVQRPKESRAAIELRPLAVPLSIAGASVDTRALLAAGLEQSPMRLAGAGAAAEAADDNVQLKPGSAMVGVLVSGDLEMSAVGTCTERIGDRVWGFGHPFNGDGATSIPMATGRINIVVPNTEISYKLGSLVRTVGQITTDHNAGVVGEIGSVARTIGLKVNVSGNALQHARSDTFQVAQYKPMLPMLMAACASNSLTASSALPERVTMRYKLRFEFSDREPFELSGTASSSAGRSPMALLFGLISVLSENPFEEKVPGSIAIDLHVDKGENVQTIVGVTAARPRVKPGGKVELAVRLQRNLHGESTRLVTFDVPSTLAPGEYELKVLDASGRIAELLGSRDTPLPIKSVSDLLDNVRRFNATPLEAIYLRLDTDKPDLTVARDTLDHFPGSRQALLLGLGDTRIGRATRAIEQIVPMPAMIEGDATIKLIVDPRARD